MLDSITHLNSSGLGKLRNIDFFLNHNKLEGQNTSEPCERAAPARARPLPTPLIAHVSPWPSAATAPSFLSRLTGGGRVALGWRPPPPCLWLLLPQSVFDEPGSWNMGYPRKRWRLLEETNSCAKVSISFLLRTAPGLGARPTASPS